MTIRRIAGRVLLAIAGGTLGITIGLVATGQLYLPTLAQSILVAGVTGLVLLVVAGGILSKDRAHSIVGGTITILAVSGGLLLGTIHLNLGATNDLLLKQLPLEPSTLTSTEEPSVLPDGHTTARLLADPTSLYKHLHDRTPLTGTSPESYVLTTPLSLGKVLTVTITPGAPGEPVELDITVNTP